MSLAVNKAADAVIVQSLNVEGMSFASFIETVRQQKPFVDDAMLTFNSANVEKGVLVLPSAKNREDGDLESFTEKTFYRAGSRLAISSELSPCSSSMVSRF